MKMDSFKAFLAQMWLGLLNNSLRLFEKILWPRSRPVDVKNVCIHRVGSIGDIVCAIPALKAIRANYPNARITLLSSTTTNMPNAKDILSNVDWLDEIWIYDQDDINRDIWDFSSDVRKRKYEIWITLPQRLANYRRQLRNMIFTWLIGANWACGFQVAITGMFKKAQERIKIFPPEHDRLLEILREKRILVNNPEMEYPISECDINVALGLINFNINNKLLGMAFGGKQSACVWPIERFVEIGRKWISAGGQVILLGGRKELGAGNMVNSMLGSSSINMCGRTSIHQTGEIIRHCRIVITNDSGPMHLSGAVGTPCIVPMTAHNYKWEWLPWGDLNRIIRKSVKCSPCHLSVCNKDNICLKEISIEDVFNEIKPFLLEGV